MAKKPLILTYTGKKKIATLNQIISPWKWSSTKQYYRREFIDLFESSKMKKVDKFSLDITYNTNHDPDNLVAVAKFFIDTFREMGYVKNDTREHYKSLSVAYDETLPKRTLQFKIIPH